MAHFLPTESLPAAPHALASVQPRGTRSATGRGGCAGKEVWFGCLHFHATLNSLGVMLCDATAGGCDTHRHTRTHAHEQTESDVQANRPISL